MTRHAMRAAAAAVLLLVGVGAQGGDAPAKLVSAPVMRTLGSGTASHDGVVEAVRQTVLAAQVPGAVVALDAKAGERVKAGQVLLRLDAQAAQQTAAAGAAQAQAARAALEAATRELERQQQLFQKRYISQAALERAEAQHKAAQAQAQAQMASAGAARTQSGFYAVKAPYDGVVSDVAVVLGDMAMPGRPLVTLYDPATLRVSARIPQSAATALQGRQQPLQLELPGTAGTITAVRWQLLPSADPATHTQELRLELPPGTPAVPGRFARAWLPGAGAGAGVERLLVPVQAVVRRAEMTAVYVLSGDGRPLLRQVRLGRAEGERVEVLSGVSAGEAVALDPQAAARQP